MLLARTIKNRNPVFVCSLSSSQNIGTLSRQGMIEADRTILKIMLEKRFAGY